MFHKLKKEAELKYGQATSRPQDVNKNLLIRARFNNLENSVEMPPRHFESVSSTIEKFELHKRDLPAVSKNQNIIWTTLKDKNTEYVTNGSKIVAVDLEFHNGDTYEGFICITSVATQGKTLVIDNLAANSDESTKHLKEMLEDAEILKVFCGANQDLIRLKKDWQCFPKCCIDVQDMFVIYKNKNYEECFKECEEAIEDKLSGAKKRILPEDYLHNLNTPGLEFLITAFIGKNAFKKDKVATHADFCKRPLHENLIQYAADDATATLVIFNYLANLIKLPGIKESMHMFTKNFKNTAKVPQYKQTKVTTDDFITTRIKKWLDYLAKNLDTDPTILLSAGNMSLLATRVKEKNLQKNEEELCTILAQMKLQDHCEKAAKLLVAYLDPAGEQLQKMKNIICHRCNEMGHTAKFCIRVLTHEEERERKREFRKREEMQVNNKTQYDRRWKNYCAKRNLDPATAKKPWSQHN